MFVVLLYALCSCVDGDGVRWKSAVVSPQYKYEPCVHKKNIMDAEASSYDESMSEPVENSNTETADEETTQTSSGEARDDLFERIETWRIITFSLLGVVLVLIVVTVFAVMSRKAPNSESDESVEV